MFSFGALTEEREEEEEEEVEEGEEEDEDEEGAPRVIERQRRG